MFMKLNKKVKYDSEFLKFYGLDGFMKVHMAFSDYMDFPKDLEKVISRGLTNTTAKGLEN